MTPGRATTQASTSEAATPAARGGARARGNGIGNLAVQTALRDATGSGDFRLGARDAPEEHEARAVARSATRADAAARMSATARSTPRPATIHDDARAHAAAAALSTRAFTADGHVFLARGAARGGDGRRLLAHEMTHAVAHRGDRVVRRDDPPSGTPVTPTAEPDIGPRYPYLAQMITPPALAQLQTAADRRFEARRLRGDTMAPTAGTPVSITVPLTDLIEPEAHFTDMDVWDLVYGIFRDQSDPPLAGEMIRNEIMRRFFTGNGIPLDSAEVTVSLDDPHGMATGHASLRFEVSGLVVKDAGGMISVVALDAALESLTRIASVSAAVASQARELGDVAGMQAQRDALDDRIPKYATDVRAAFKDHSLASIRASAQRVGQLKASADSMAGNSFGGGFVGDLSAGLQKHVDTLSKLQEEAQAWHATNQPELTTGELYEKDGAAIAGYALRQYDEGGAGGYALGTLAIGGAGVLAILDGLDNMLSFGFQDQEADIARAFRRGDISKNDMVDLTESAAIRAAVTGVVTIAITIATAGIGGAVAGSLGLARGTLMYAAVGTGVEGALGNVVSLGTSTLLTSVRSYDDPFSQAIWSSGGASSGMDFVEAGAMGFGLGALTGPALGYGGFGRSTALSPRANALLEGAQANAPRWNTVSLGVDVATGMERHWAQHAVTGEIFEVGFNAKSGTGYIRHAASGSTRTFGPGGLDGFNAGLLGEGGAPITLGGDAPLVTVGRGTGGDFLPSGGASLGVDSKLAAMARELNMPAPPARTPLMLTVGDDPVVWVNTKSGVFHASGSQWFNNTQSGVALPRSHAMMMGAREAGLPRASRPITPFRNAAGTQMESSGAGPRGPAFFSASAQKPPAMITAIGADVAEASGYQHSLKAGEYGLGRPGGANVPGSDYLTAARVDGKMTIFVNDTKYSSVGNFPKPDPTLKRTWRREVWDAVSSRRLSFGDAALEAEIREAVAANRIVKRQVNVSVPAQGTEGVPRVEIATTPPSAPIVTPPPKPAAP